PALDRGKVWHVPYPLDVEAMRQAAAHLIGKHDFTTFRSAHCQSKSAIKSLTAIDIEGPGDTGTAVTCPEISLKLRAPSFLHNQVRSIVGTLERVGAGRWHPDEVRSALNAQDRSRCGPVAPAHGLYFVKALYEDELINV
ncbi:MAG: tRNA pseudouridine(38-40) synthase TruA, partial [Pseudomonadota bacterium]